MIRAGGTEIRAAIAEYEFAVAPRRLFFEILHAEKNTGGTALLTAG